MAITDINNETIRASKNIDNTNVKTNNKNNDKNNWTITASFVADNVDQKSV